MSSWRTYVAQHASIAPEARVTYWDDVSKTECNDGDIKERTAFSQQLAHDAIHDLHPGDERSLMSAVRILTRKVESGKPWMESKPFALVEKIALSGPITMENDAVIEAYSVLVNLTTLFHCNHKDFLSRHALRIYEVYTNENFYPPPPKYLERDEQSFVETTESNSSEPLTHLDSANITPEVQGNVKPIVYVGILVLSLVSDPCYQTMFSEEKRNDLKSFTIRMLVRHAPSRPDYQTCTLPQYMVNLMAVASQIIEIGASECAELYQAAHNCLLVSAFGSGCPASPMIQYSAMLLTQLIPPEDLPEPRLVELAEKMSRLVILLLIRYIDPVTGAELPQLREDTRVSFEQTMMSIVTFLASLLEPSPLLCPIVLPYFFELNEASQPVRPLLPYFKLLMSSKHFPLISLLFGFLMFYTLRKDVVVFVDMFGWESCVHVLKSLQLPAPPPKESKDGRDPIAHVTVYDENEENVPEGVKSIEELEELLECLKEKGITLENPLRLAEEEGLADTIDQKMQLEDKEEEERELRDAEEALAKWAASKKGPDPMVK